jgi:trehalose utilization protein
MAGNADNHANFRVTVWGENVHEHRDESVRKIYPDGMHETIAAALRDRLGDAVVRTATLDQPEHGLSAEVLESTDVLTWWGHIAHGDVDDAVVEAVCDRVYRGMGLIVLHSAHWSKVFRKLMGTSCNLRWRSADDREVVWTVNPAHPVADGIPDHFVIDRQEMYGEIFEIPQPDELVFVSGFSGGEVFRSGCAFNRGFGRIFYFSPGDQEFPVYHHPVVQQVIANAVGWSRRRSGVLEKRYEIERKDAGWFEAEAAGAEAARP